MVRFLSFSLFLVSFIGYAQPFQTVLTLPGTDSYEAALAITPMGLAVGQTNSFSNVGMGRRVLFSRYNTNSASTHRVYPNLPGQSAQYEAIDVKPITMMGFAGGSYILGNLTRTIPTTGQTVSGIFVTRVNLAGGVVWHREYTPPAQQQLRLRAVSVEVMNDMGPVAVANVIDGNTGAQEILVSRLTLAGVQVWSNRYRHNSCQGQLSIISANESVKDITGAPPTTGILCTGAVVQTPQAAEAIVITGDFQPCDPAFVATYGNSRRTFALKINERGVEIWRFAYPSYANASTSDAGFDLVQLPNRNFWIAGRHVATANGTSRTNIYGVEIQPNGNLVCGAVHFSSEGYNTFARGITLSRTSGNVVLTGPLDSLGIARRIMVAEFPGSCNPYLWAKLYPKSAPATQSEGIDRLAGNQLGYFVTANSRHYGTTDPFAMRTDLTGGVKSCPVVDFKLVREPATKFDKIRYCQQPLGDWVNVPVQSVAVQPPPRICIDLTAPIIGAAINVPGEVTEAVHISLYPNPSAQEVQVYFTTEHVDGEVVVADLMGNVVSRGTFRSNDKQVRLSVSTLPTGLYTVRVIQTDGKSNSARLVKE